MNIEIENNKWNLNLWQINKIKKCQIKNKEVDKLQLEL